MSRQSVSTSTSESTMESDLSEEEKVSMENFALLRVLGKGGSALFIIIIIIVIIIVTIIIITLNPFHFVRVIFAI
ncbi:unnamed protein product [Gongylonema pulchrum]|uniref:GrBNV_gp40-like protein n=1 Tax=Gongylonema pulchrum TaxID=637853 RepID=A0A183ELX2_9BILA|nr:unnamed protein product [Gongylonema pulchrum]